MDAGAMLKIKVEVAHPLVFADHVADNVDTPTSVRVTTVSDNKHPHT